MSDLTDVTQVTSITDMEDSDSILVIEEGEIKKIAKSDFLCKTEEQLNGLQVLTTTRTNNLLNPENVLSNMALNAKGVTPSATETWYLNEEYIEVEENVMYCFYAEGFTGDYTSTGYRVVLYCYDAEKNFVKSITGSATIFELYSNIMNQTVCRVKTFTIPEGCQYVRLQYFATLQDCSLSFQKYDTFEGIYEPYVKMLNDKSNVSNILEEKLAKDFKGNLNQYAMNLFTKEKTISGLLYKEATGICSSTTQSMLLGVNPIIPTKDYVFYSLDFIDSGAGYNVSMVCLDENKNVLRLVTSEKDWVFTVCNGVKCKTFRKYSADNNNSIPADTKYCALVYTSTLDACDQNVFCMSEYASTEYKKITEVPFAMNVDVEQMKQSINELGTQMTGDSELDKVKQSITDLETKIDSLVAASTETDGNLELLDIRNGVDGKVYPTAGSAIRNTMSEIFNPTNKSYWLYCNSFMNTIDLLTCYANSLYYDAEAFKYRVKLGYSGETESHDANLQMKNGIAYVTCIVNQTGVFADDPTAGHTLSRLCVFDTSLLGTNSPAFTSYVIAEHGTILPDGTLIDGGTGITNCNFIDDTTLRCTFMAHPADGAWGEYYRDFDISTNTFGDITLCKITKDGVTLDFTVPNVYQLFGINSNYTTKSIFTNAQTAYEEASGTYYRAMWIRDFFDSGVILKSTDLASYEFFMIPEYSKKTHMNYECSLFCDQNGKLYVAMRQAKISSADGSTELLVATISLEEKTVLQEISIADCSMKPCFFSDGTNIYLFHGTNRRKRFEIIEINQAYLIDSKIIMQSALGCVYPSIQKAGDYYYIASTGNSNTAIYLRKFKLSHFTAEDVSAKFVSLLGIDQLEI